jgi:hypothetical protein
LSSKGKWFKQRLVLFLLNLVVLWVLCFPGFSKTTVSVLTESLDQLSERYASGLEMMYFGGQSFLQKKQISVTGYGSIGTYGYEGILDGYGVSIQTAAFSPWGFGVSAGVFEAPFNSWILGLNAQKDFHLKKWAILLFQGAIGHQRKSKATPKALHIHGQKVYDPAYNPLILVENISWNHAFAHLIFKVEYLFIHPILDLGFLVSHCSYTGNKCINNDPLKPGDSTRGGETSSKFTSGLGLSLDIGNVRVFGGVSSANFFLANIALIF